MTSARHDHTALIDNPRFYAWNRTALPGKVLVDELPGGKNRDAPVTRSGRLVPDTGLQTPTLIPDG